MQLNFRKKITSGILATVIALAPIAPEVKVIADEITPPSETQIVESNANSDDGTQATVVVETTPVHGAETEYSEPVDETTPETVIDTTEPSDSIDSTAPPTTEGTEASDNTEATEPSDTEEPTTVEPSETTEATEPTESSETSETTEPSETTERSETPTPTETPEVEITCVPVCETLSDYNAFIASIGTEVWKIYVVTTDDLTGLTFDDGRYFNGEYCFRFNTEETFNNAVTYLTSNEYEFTKVEAVKPSKIVLATSFEEFVTYISGMSGAKLIINTSADISKDLDPDFGVYFEGTYVISFVDQSQYLNAVTYCANKGYEYSIDGDVAVCGAGFGGFSNYAINPEATVKVAIIDTGSSLANEAYCVLEGDDGNDRNGHGTRMAEDILSVTDNAYIISIKALGDDGHGDISDVYNAVQLAKEMKVDYILLALSTKDTGDYDAFTSLIADCKADGITVVASAGNNNKSASEYIPANCATYSIGALNNDGTKNVFSNFDASYYVVANSTSDASALFIGGKIAGVVNYVSAFKTSTDADDNTLPVDSDYNPNLVDDGGASESETITSSGALVDFTYDDEFILGINTTKINGVHIHVYGTEDFSSRVYVGTNTSSAPTIMVSKQEIDNYRATLPAAASAQMTDQAIANSLLGNKINDYMEDRRAWHNANTFGTQNRQNYSNRVKRVYDDMIGISGIVDDGGYSGTITDVSFVIDGGWSSAAWGTGYYAYFYTKLSANYNWDVTVKATYTDDGATLSSANATIYGLKSLGTQYYDFIGTSDPEESVNYNTVANNLNTNIINANNGSKAVRLDSNGIYDGSGNGGHWGSPYTYCMEIHTGYGGDLGSATHYHIAGFHTTAEPLAQSTTVDCPQNTGGNNNVHDIALVLGSNKSAADKQGWVWQYLCESAGVTIEDAHKNVSIPNESSFSSSGTFDTGVRYTLAVDYTDQTVVDGKLLVVPGQVYRLPVTITDKLAGGKTVKVADIAPDAQEALLKYVKSINTANTGLVVSLDTNVTGVSTNAGYIVIDATNVSAINFGVLGAGATMTVGGGATNDNVFSFSSNLPYAQWYDYEVWGYNRSGQDQIRGAFHRYIAQYHAYGLDIPVITNLYVYVVKESANSNSYNNCYSMEGLTFRMEGNNKTYQFTQPMGQTGGQTQAIKLTVDDIVANNWNVYENDGTLPVRNFNGYDYNSGYLYNFDPHAVDYTTAYYDPTYPVQGGGVADDGAVIRVLVQNEPDKDPIHQFIKKEDDEQWDEVNDLGVASTSGIQFTVYYYADYFYDANSVTYNIRNYTDSTALKNYFDSHTPTDSTVITLSGDNTNQYGMFTLNGLTCPKFAMVQGQSGMRYGTYIVQETKTNEFYYLNDTPLFGMVTSQGTNGMPDEPLEQMYFYNNETNNGPMGNTLYVRQYPAQASDAQCVTFNDKVVYGYASLDKVNTLPTGVNEPLNGYAQGTSIDNTVYGVYSQAENKLYAVVVLDEDGNMKSVTYPDDIKPDEKVAPIVRLTGGSQYFRLPTGDFYATEIRPTETNDIANAGTYPDGTTNSGTLITQFVGQTVNQSMFYGGMYYNFTSGVQGEKLNFTVTACHELDVASGEQPSDDEITKVHATDYSSNAEFDFYLNKKAYNGWTYIGAEFTLYYDEACTQPIMTLTDNNDGHYVSTQAGNLRDYLTFSPTSYTVSESGDLLFNYNEKVYVKETKAPTILRDNNGNEWNIPEQNQTELLDTESVYTVQIDLTNVSQTTHIGTLTYTMSGGQIATPYSVQITNYHAHQSHNYSDDGQAQYEGKNIVISNNIDNFYYEDSMSGKVFKSTDTPFLDVNNNGQNDSTDYHFDINTTTFFITSGPLAGGYPTFTMAQLKEAKKNGQNLLKDYMKTQTNLIGYYEFGEDQWYDSAGNALPDGWDRLYGLVYDKTYYIYEIFEVPEYAYDNDNDSNPPASNGVYDIAGEIYEIVTAQNGTTSRVNTPRTASSIPYPNVATSTTAQIYNSSSWTQSSYFNTMWEMHFDSPEDTAHKMAVGEDSVTYAVQNHLMYGDIDLNKVWSEDNTDDRNSLAGYEFLFEYGGNLDKAYWDMDSSEMEAIGMPAYNEMPHTYIIRLTDINGNIHLEDIPAGWYRISENTNNMEVRFHSNRGADPQARATVKLVDQTEEVFYVVNVMDVPVYANKYDTWTGEPIVIDPFTGEKRPYEGNYAIRFELYSDTNKDGKITGAEKDNVRTIVDRPHSGIVAFNGLKSGQYAVREIITADGYYLDTGYRFVTIYDLNNNGSITDDIFEVKLYDEPYSAPITIEKLDSETKEPIKNAEFTIYYDNGSVEGEWDEQDEIAMTFEPQLDANGKQMFEQIALGYYDVDGNWQNQLDAEGNQVYVDGKPLGTYRQARVWWDDAQGKYVSDPLRAYHVWNSTTGQFEHRNYVVVESKLPYGYSFADANGEPTVKPDQAIFAIEYPDMQVDASGKAELYMDDDYQLQPVENVVEVKVQNFVMYNAPIKIETEALSLHNGNHTLEVGNIVSLDDTIKYHNLAPTGRYTFRAELYAKDDLNTVLSNATVSVVPEAKDGTTKVTFENVNSAKLVEGVENADGTVTFTAKDLVVYVYCDWDSDFDIYDGQRADHCDVADTLETVTVVPPTVTTTFVDTVSGSHLTPIGENVPMNDAVKTTNLNVGETYYAEAVLVNGETGEKLIDRDTNQPYTNRVSFVPTAENHNECVANVPFEVDTVDFVKWNASENKLETIKIVCFERIYASDGTLIAVHEDLKDENQTVTIVPPTLHTTLIDVASNSHRGSLGTAIVIRDKVDYENASEGTEYTFRGQIWEVKSDGTLGEKLFDGDSDTTFTATSREGTEYVYFSDIDSTKLCNDGQPVRIVCFEYMYCKAMVDDDNDDTTPMVEKEIQISSHEDVTDQNQNIDFKPELETTLLVVKGENDGDDFDNKLVLDNTVQTYADTVHHHDLVVGETYNVTASLVDQETGSQLYRSEGGEALTQTLTYVPETADGDYVVEFKDVDSGTFGYYRTNEETGEQEFVKPNQIVAFETLTSKTGFVFDMHKDLTDENQTIHRPHYLRVSIAKMDRDNVKYYLANAEITVYTGDGNVAKDVNGNDCVGLTNSEGKIEFVIRYVEGQTYYAMETKAPAGYNLNTDKHQIKPVSTTDYGKEEIIPISVFDRAIIIPPTPKTGDSMPIMALVALIIVGAVGLTTVFVVKGKKKSAIEANSASIEGNSNENPEE